MSDLAGAPVLVTGGAGFIGSHLVEALVAQGRDVVVVDDLTTGRRSNLAAVELRVDIRTSDLLGADLVTLLKEGGFGTIFHLAANAYVPPSVEDPRSDLELNLLATFNLLEAMRATACPAPLVHVSSAAVYGDRAVKPFEEDDPTVPVSPYAVSKLAAERYVAVYARIYGLRTATVRLFPVYGPRLRKQVIYDLMAKVQGDPTVLHVHGDGTQVRDFNHVANVVEAMLLVAREATLGGEVYNVAGEEPTSIADLVTMLCQEMGVMPRIVFSGEVRPGDSQRWTADTTRLRALGYRPRRRLAEGLAETAAWFRAEAGTPVTTE